MLNISSIEDLQGQLCSVKANQPILLDNPQIVWVIQSGELALFASDVIAGIPEGTRQYLFSVSAGDALFGISQAGLEAHLSMGSHNNNRSILAVPLIETQLVKVQAEQLWQLIGNADPGAKQESFCAIALVEGWIHHLETASGGNTVNTRLLALAPTRPDTLQERLLSVQAHFYRYLVRLEKLEQEKQRLRFQAREHINRQATAEALGELASLVQEGRDVTNDTFTSAPVLSGKSEILPLVVAIDAIARALRSQRRAGVPRHEAQRREPPHASGSPVEATGVITIRSQAKLETLSESDSLEAIARTYGLRMRQVLLTDCWWKKDCGPMLAYTWPDRCPVALLPAATGGFELFYPEAGLRTQVNASIATNLVLPDAYTFYRPLPDCVRTSKATSNTAWNILQFALQGRAKDLRVILWSGIAATLLGMLTPHATAVLIDHIIPAADRELLVQIGFGLLAAALGATSFQLAQGFAILRLESFADASTQAAVWDRLLSLGVPFFRQYSTGDLESRVSAISKIRRQLSGTALRGVFSSVFSLLNLVLLFYYSWSLALVACVFAAIAVAGTTISGVLTLRQLRPLQELQGKTFGVIVQLINGVAKLRVAGATERAFAYWTKIYSQQVRLMLRTQRLEDYLAVFNAVLPTVSSGFLFWFAVLLIQAVQVSTNPAAQVSTGTFLAFNTAFGIFVAGATGLSESLIETLGIVTLWELALPILKAQPEADGSKADPGQLSGQLGLDHVTFRYRDDEPPVLEDVSLYAEPGELIALVGPSGSGKSTVLRLLLGFEIPQSGQVYYDEKELRGLDIYAVRRQLGVVLQNSRLNNASIFENIASGIELNMDQAWEAARQAAIADEIAAMPMGMHTIVSEGGTNLSGGQRQRLLITRALVSQPHILLLDEATSFLDNKAQAIITESLDKLQVTRVVIAHRLSTIRNADRIYVFEAGRVVQQGRFEQLANQEGLFARLMQRQMV